MIIEKYSIKPVRKKGTFGLHIINVENKKVTTPIIQFTIKNPWYLPKIDMHYIDRINSKKDTHKTTGWLAGWLLFYFGIMHTE